MSDVHGTQTNPPTDQTTPPLPNSDQARTPDGTIKDQQTPPQSSAQTEGSITPPKDGDKPGDKPVIPEKYEFKAPEGYELSAETIEEVTPVLKELGITQDGANKLFEFFQKHTSNTQQELIDAYADVRKDWRTEIAGDKTIGNGKDGLSPETSKNVTAAMNFLPQDLQQPLRDAMNLTGMGDNPAMIRALNHIGKALGEGTLVPGGKPSPLGQKPPNAAPKSLAQAMYPSLASANSGT